MMVAIPKNTQLRINSAEIFTAPENKIYTRAINNANKNGSITETKPPSHFPRITVALETELVIMSFKALSV